MVHTCLFVTNPNELIPTKNMITKYRELVYFSHYCAPMAC